MKHPLTYAVLVLGVLALAGCEDEPPSSTTLARQSAPQQDAEPQDDYLCDDLVKSLGAKDAFAVCVEQAESGNIHANATLGAMYARGLLGGVDWPKANHWLLQAARLGHPEAQFIVGRSFELGRGIEKNQTQALSWLRKSAQANFAQAQTHLGELETDPKLKYFWLSKSAANGHALGMYHLAQLYLSGDGVMKDYSQAEKLLISAAQKGEPLAMLQLGDFYRSGLFGYQPEQANFWYQQALETQTEDAHYHLADVVLTHNWQLNIDPIALMQQAATEGHAKAQLALAKLYHAGEKLPKNEDLAFQWYLAAAEQDQGEALYQVGLSFAQGSLGQSKELDKGIYYLKQAVAARFKAAEEALNKLSEEGNAPLPDNFQTIERLHKSAQAGSLDAQVKLAKLLMAYGVPRYDSAAYHWATKAALTQQPNAQLLLAECYAGGIGTPVNYDKAFALYLNLAEQNIPAAQYKIGQMYYQGLGTFKDKHAAKKWLLSAAKANIQEAKQMALNIYQTESDNNDEEIPEWLDFAADNGHPKALYMKGMNTLYGNYGHDQNIEQGLQLLEQAAQKHYPLAYREIGNIYMQGLFGQEDLHKAHASFLMAAKLGDEYSQYRLAHMYYYGIGVERSYVQSYVWANITAQKGHTDGTLLRDELAGMLNSDEIESAQSLQKMYLMSER